MSYYIYIYFVQRDHSDFRLETTHAFNILYHPASILYKSIAGRYRPVSYPDGPITARYRFIKNAYWAVPFAAGAVQ